MQIRVANGEKEMTVECGKGAFWPLRIEDGSPALKINWGGHIAEIYFDNPREALEFAAGIVGMTASRVKAK